MVDAVLDEQLAQREALHVGEGVVGHQSLRDDPVRGEEGERAFHEAGDGCRLLVVEQFDVGEPGVVVGVPPLR
jgi:hypothetical protein